VILNLLHIGACLALIFVSPDVAIMVWSGVGFILALSLIFFEGISYNE